MFKLVLYNVDTESVLRIDSITAFKMAVSSLCDNLKIWTFVKSNLKTVKWNAHYNFHEIHFIRFTGFWCGCNSKWGQEASSITNEIIKRLLVSFTIRCEYLVAFVSRYYAIKKYILNIVNWIRGKPIHLECA